MTLQISINVSHLSLLLVQASATVRTIPVCTMRLLSHMRCIRPFQMAFLCIWEYVQHSNGVQGAMPYPVVQFFVDQYDQQG